jgi:hypothetical protein
VPLVIALGLLVAVALGIFWFLRSNPTTVARVARPILFVGGAIALGALLLLAIEFVPGLLPELFGLAGVVATALIARWARNRPSPAFSTPGSGSDGRTEVRTKYLQAWIDHGSGDVGGSVLQGRFTGRTLDSLGDGDLHALHADCADDADSLKVLESYLDRRLGSDWRQAERPQPPRGPRVDMTRAEALAVLGLAEGASADEIRAAHRRLIQRVHPDVGGSADLAARINRAKDVLLGV